jgi:site-specific DNA-methyltransferase (adenine-specific)
MTYNVLCGNNIAVLKQYPDNHFDSIVTDPPYGIDFLGKAWDANTGALETYQECLRVLKPGGHILAFSAARTYHHLAVTLEQAGFEIRDQIMWIYSSGFPKSQDVGRQLHKKTHGKPDKQRFDPAIMIKVNADLYSHPITGKIYRALPDINGDRLAVSHEGEKYGTVYEEVIEVDNEWTGWGTQLKPAHEPIALARKPIKLTIAKNCQKYGTGAINIDATRIGREDEDARFPSNVIGEITEPYQKYFYCPKVSRKERHVGFDDPGPMFQGSRTDIYQPNKNSPDIQITSAEKKAVPQNNHPTVKPIELMKYLIKLVTPQGGTVLDPFNGSGSTGCAAVELGYNYVGIDLDPHYVEISLKRIEAWCKDDMLFNQLFQG